MTAQERRTILIVSRELRSVGRVRVADMLDRMARKPAAIKKKLPARHKNNGNGSATEAIRSECVRRADGLCEACRSCKRLQMDHWLGGGGRRKQSESIENCWMLCVPCHLSRTENYPSAAHWNLVFESHCANYGYKFTPHMEHVR